MASLFFLSISPLSKPVSDIEANPRPGNPHCNLYGKRMLFTFLFLWDKGERGSEEGKERHVE